MNIKKRKLSKESTFYFLTSIGKYTSESATPVEDFLEEIERIDIKSIEFHFHRDDFEKGLTETTEDKELGEQIKKLHNQNLTGEKLRAQLHHVISKRYECSITSHGRNQ